MQSRLTPATTIGAAPALASEVPSFAASVLAAPVLTSSPPATPSAPVLTEPERLPFTWVGSPWSLVRICIFNAFLTVLTVGVYNFWGRTEIRRRTWSSVHLLGDPLVYHGTGRELFRGFMTIFAMVLVPILLIGTVMIVLYGQASMVWGLYQAGLFLVVYPLLKAIATYRARRYRLSRTTWRGIVGRMNGSSTEFAFVSWSSALLYPLTLGWIAPWRQTYLQSRLSNETELGNHKLVNTATSGPVYVPYFILWIGTIALYFGIFFVGIWILGPAKVALIRAPMGWTAITRSDVFSILGLIFAAIFIWSLMSSFYRATLYNRLAKFTFLVAPALKTSTSVPSLYTPTPFNTDTPPSPLRFRLKVRAPALIWLFVTNQLLIYLSLFTLKPVAVARTLKYYCEHLAVVGPFDPGQIGQHPDRSREGGEGLAQAFDVDAF